MFRLILICVLFELVTVGTLNNSFTWKHSQGSNTETQAVLDVDFCELVRNPDKYDKKHVRVRAVLLENHKPRIDGHDSHLYSPGCRGDEKAIFVEAHKDRQKDDPEIIKSFQKLQEKRDKFGNSRVLITATGLFEKADKSGFGHLSWANFRLLVMQFEKVEKFSGK